MRRYIRDVDAQLDGGNGLWFTGVVGSGKTTLAMLVSKAAMEADRTVAIYSLPRLLALLRESFDDDAQYSLNQISTSSRRSTCCTSTTSARSRPRRGCSSSSTRS